MILSMTTVTTVISLSEATGTDQLVALTVAKISSQVMVVVKLILVSDYAVCTLFHITITYFILTIDNLTYVD